MAKKCSTPLAAIKTNLTNITAAIEDTSDHILRCIARQASDPDGPATLWLLSVWHASVFAYAIRCNRLVLCVIQTDGHTLDRGAC